MEPYAEFTKLEQWDENGKPFLAEVRTKSIISRVGLTGQYKGSGKLKGKTAIVTGGMLSHSASGYR